MLSIDESYSAIRNTAAVYERGGEVVRLTGTHRARLLSWLLAKQTEFAEPGTVVESLILDEDGEVDGVALVVLDEDSIVVVAHCRKAILDLARSAIDDQGLEGTFANAADDLSGIIAVEGPLSWQVAAHITDEPMSELLLNEWRRSDLIGVECLLIRTGTTAEYGYVVMTSSAAASSVKALFAASSENIGGGVINDIVLHRAQAEVNHPVLPSQAKGLTIFEAGIQWMATLNRDDDFRGKDGIRLVPPVRKLVAACSHGQDFPEEGAIVTDGEKSLGTVQVSTSRAGLDSGFGLLLLDVPYCVPGLTLTVGNRTVTTVSRPAVDPQSWTQQIGV